MRIRSVDPERGGPITKISADCMSTGAVDVTSGNLSEAGGAILAGRGRAGKTGNQLPRARNSMAATDFRSIKTS